MPLFNIEIAWTVKGVIEIEAEDVNAALDAAKDAPLPADQEYVGLDWAVEHSSGTERVY